MNKTKHLGLNVTDMSKDGNEKFNFDKDLGYNFNTLDEQTLTHRNITNCILEIPQDINLDLSNGVLTLLAGSKVYVPNGLNANGEKIFEEFIIDKDFIFPNANANGTYFLYINKNYHYRISDYNYSGDTPPTINETYAIWYDTAQNLIKATNDNGANWAPNTWALPLCLATVTEANKAYDTINQVFNGYGYIGSALFELPGVKGLIVDGVNDDGSLKTVIKTTTKVSLDYVVGPRSNAGISNLNDTLEGALWLGEFDNHPNANAIGSPRYLNTKTNSIQLYKSTSEGWVTQNGFLQVLESLKVDTAGKILSMTPKKPFRAVDYNDYQAKITELETRITALETAITALNA